MMSQDVGADAVTRVGSWITPQLEQILQRAVDIANEHGHDQLSVEHVALAIISDTEAVQSHGESTVSVAQWRHAIIDAMSELPVLAQRPYRRTDLFCWHTTDRR